ncbi:MAG: hypothetical protein JWO47_253 [Candidatus Saccharibacteria bacterium]|nr:hypothetical protein [Candidatus Saccharibacteria bacterium]
MPALKKTLVFASTQEYTSLKVSKNKKENMTSINKNQGGIIHHLLLLVIFVGVVGAIGFTGMKVWRSHQAGARTYNWSYLYPNNDWNVYACKTSSTTGKVYIKNQTGYKLQTTISNLGTIDAAAHNASNVYDVTAIDGTLTGNSRSLQSGSGTSSYSKQFASLNPC